MPLYSAFKAVSLLHPTSDHEVRCISNVRIPPCRSISGDRRFPYTANTPRRIPLEQAVPHHCGHSLLGVTSGWATFVRRQTRDSQLPDHPATLHEYSWQLNPCVSVKLRPSETGQSPRHRVYVPRHIHRSSLKHIFVEDKDSRLPRAANQVNTTKLQRPTNRFPQFRYRVVQRPKPLSAVSTKPFTSERLSSLRITSPHLSWVSPTQLQSGL